MSHAKVARLVLPANEAFGHVRRDRLTPRESSQSTNPRNHRVRFQRRCPSGSGAFF